MRARLTAAGLAAAGLAAAGLAAAALPAMAGPAAADDAVPAAEAAAAAQGAVEEFIITNRYRTAHEGGGGSGSSSGSTVYTEVVRAEPEGCRSRSFDVVDSPQQPRPLAIWQFPLVLRECPGEPPVLANRAAMLARRDAFLAAMGVGEEACGKHYFTWNVFQIECDPDEALRSIAGVDLAAIRLEDGAEHIIPDTRTRVTLTRAADAPPGQLVFTASAPVDPAFLRDRAARAITVVAEVSGETVTPEAAMAQIASRQFAGETAIRLVAEPAAGRITATITGEVRETGEDGTVETRKGEIVTIRERTPPPAPPG